MRTRGATGAILIIGAFLGGNAGAGSVKQADLHRLVWSAYESRIDDGRTISVRFPSSKSASAHFEFAPSPTPDRYTKNLDVIGMQMRAGNTSSPVNELYNVAIALVPVRSSDIGHARSAERLSDALKSYLAARGRVVDRLLAKPASFEVIRLGDADWVRVRFVQQDGSGTAAWDSYYRPWNGKRVMRLELRFGKDVAADSDAIAHLRRLTEEIASSVSIQ